MENPWIKYANEKDIDCISDKNRDYINKINDRRKKDERKIKFGLRPDAYMGRLDAPIVILQLNPGYNKEKDEPAQTNPKFIELWKRNILQQEMDYPFYPLNPALDGNWGGNEWWNKRLNRMIDRCGKKKVSEKICCIEYFPYHSIKFAPLKDVLDCQYFSFHLLKKAIARKAFVLVMRSRKNWIEQVPELEGHPNVFFPNSPQCAYITERNLGRGDRGKMNFERLCEIIQRE